MSSVQAEDFEIIEDRHGKSCKILYPAKKLTENYFVIGLHKAGSVLLNNLAHRICEAAGYPTVPIGSFLFASGMTPAQLTSDQIKKIDRLGYVFTTMRTFYIAERMPSYQQSNKILLVRDPRDAAVSYFFSALYSHLRPGEGSAARVFDGQRQALAQHDVSSAITSGLLDKLFRNQLIACTHKFLAPNITIYRYEDVIFDKFNWVKSLCICLKCELDESVMRVIAADHDLLPEKEEISQHVRQVRPGNHKKHLTEEANKYIKNHCGVFFSTFGYSW